MADVEQSQNNLPHVKYKTILNLYNRGIVQYPKRGRVSKRRLKRIFRKIFEPRVLLTDIATLSLFQVAKDGGNHHNLTVKSEYNSDKYMQYYMVKKEIEDQQNDQTWTKVDICEEMLHREVKKEFEANETFKTENIAFELNYGGHTFEPNLIKCERSDSSCSDTVFDYTSDSTDKPLNLAKSNVKDVDKNMQIVPTGLDHVENELVDIYRPSSEIENELMENEDYVEQFKSMLDNYNLEEFGEVFGENMEQYHTIQNEPFSGDLSFDILPQNDYHVKDRGTEARPEYYCDKDKLEFMSKLGLQSIHRCSSPVVNIITVQDDGTVFLVNQKKCTDLLNKDMFSFTHKALLEISDASDVVDLSISGKEGSGKDAGYGNQDDNYGNNNINCNSVMHYTTKPAKQADYDNVSGKSSHMNGKMYRKNKSCKHKHSFRNHIHNKIVAKHRTNNNCKQRLKNNLKMYARDFQIYAHQRKSTCHKVKSEEVRASTSQKSHTQLSKDNDSPKSNAKKSIQDNDLKLLHVINKLKCKRQNKNKLNSAHKHTEFPKCKSQAKAEAPSIQVLIEKESDSKSKNNTKKYKEKESSTEQKTVKDRKEYFMRQRKVLKFPSSYDYITSASMKHKSNNWMRLFKSPNKNSWKPSQFNSKSNNKRKYSKKSFSSKKQGNSSLCNLLNNVKSQKNRIDNSIHKAQTESDQCNPKKEEIFKQSVCQSPTKRGSPEDFTDNNDDSDYCSDTKDSVCDNLDKRYSSKEGRSGKQKRTKHIDQPSVGDNPARILMEFSKHNWLLNKYHLLSEKSSSGKCENELPNLESKNIHLIKEPLSNNNQNGKTSDTDDPLNVPDNSARHIPNEQFELNQSPKKNQDKVTSCGADQVDRHGKTAESGRNIARTSSLVSQPKTSTSVHTSSMIEPLSNQYNPNLNSTGCNMPPNVTVIKPANNLITPLQTAGHTKYVHTTGPVLPKVICGSGAQTKHSTVHVLPPPVIVICNSNIPPSTVTHDSQQINYKSPQGPWTMNSHNLIANNVNIVAGVRHNSTCDDTHNSQSVKLTTEHIKSFRENYSLNSVQSTSAVPGSSVSMKNITRPVLPKLSLIEGNVYNIPTPANLHSSPKTTEPPSSRDIHQNNEKIIRPGIDTRKLNGPLQHELPYSQGHSLEDKDVPHNSRDNRQETSSKHSYIDLTLDNGAASPNNKERSAASNSRYSYEGNANKSQSKERSDSCNRNQMEPSIQISLKIDLPNYESDRAPAKPSDDEELRKLKDEYEKVNKIFKRLTDIEQKKDKERRLLQQKKMQTTQLMQTIKHHYESLQRGKIVGMDNISKESFESSKSSSDTLIKTPPPAHSKVTNSNTQHFHKTVQVSSSLNNKEQSSNKSNNDVCSPVDLSKKLSITKVPRTAPLMPFQSRLRNSSIPYPPPLITMPQAQQPNPKNDGKVCSVEEKSPIYMDSTYSTSKQSSSMDKTATVPVRSSHKIGYSQSSPDCQIIPSTISSHSPDCQIIPSANAQVIHRPPIHSNMSYRLGHPKQVQQITSAQIPPNSPQILNHRPTLGEMPTLVSSNRMINHGNANASIYAHEQGQVPIRQYYPAHVANRHPLFSKNPQFQNSPAFPTMQRQAGHYQSNPNFPPFNQGVNYPGQMIRVRQIGASQPYQTKVPRSMNTNAMDPNISLPNHNNKAMPSVGPHAMGCRFVAQKKTETPDSIDTQKLAVVRNDRNVLWQQYTQGVLRCGICQGPAMFVCSQCKEMPYCSEACQTKSWPKHGPMCAKYMGCKQTMRKDSQ